MVTTIVTSEEEERVYVIILHGIEARMNGCILKDNFDAMRTNNEAAQGYHLVKWITEPYTVKKNTAMKGWIRNILHFSEKLFVMLCFGIQHLIQCIGIHWWLKRGWCYNKIEESVDTRCEDEKDKRNEYPTKQMQQETCNTLRSNVERWWYCVWYNRRST